MARRKGELNKLRIDSGWPHQVVLPASATTGKVHDAILKFCANLSLCPRGHVFVRDGEYQKAWCFAEAEDAAKFQARFGGEFIVTKDRPRWPG